MFSLVAWILYHVISKDIELCIIFIKLYNSILKVNITVGLDLNDILFSFSVWNIYFNVPCTFSFEGKNDEGVGIDKNIFGIEAIIFVLMIS